jgi:hypothetical protein
VDAHPRAPRASSCPTEIDGTNVRAGSDQDPNDPDFEIHPIRSWNRTVILLIGRNDCA